MQTGIWVSFLVLWLLFGVAVAFFISVWGYGSFSFDYDVPVFAQLTFLEQPHLYGWIHLLVFLPVFLLSFDKKVYFASGWKYLFPVIIAVAIPFLIWDHFFTHAGVWAFNENYISGIKILTLPIEEILFFVTVPFACAFIFDCLNAYFPKNKLILWEHPITILILLFFVVMAVVFQDNIYTISSCLLAAITLIWVKSLGERDFLAKYYRAFLVISIPFILIDGILTGGFTSAPVVLYDADHFSGLRLVSIPLEDFIYGFALLLQVNYLYVEWRRGV